MGFRPPLFCDGFGAGSACYLCGQPPNPADGNATSGFNWGAGPAGRGSQHEFNPDILDDPKYMLLVPYGVNHLQLKCPADHRIGKYQGKDPNKVGTKIPAARTFSMS